MASNFGDRTKQLIALRKKLQQVVVANRNAPRPTNGRPNQGAERAASIFDEINELTQINYTLDKEEREGGGWSVIWKRRRSFEGAVSATFIRLTTSGKYEVTYNGRRIIAEGRGDRVLRLGDTVELTATDSGYSISW